MAIKFNNNDNGGYFVDMTPTNNRVNNQLTNAARRYNDDDAFGAALAVGLAAAFVGAAAAVAADDYDYRQREAERARREAEEAARRAREEERRAREEQRYLENRKRELLARVNRINGLTLDEVTDKVAEFCVKPNHEDIMKRVFTVRLVLKTLWNQGVRFQKVYDYDRHNLTITGQDIDGRTVTIELSWTGKIKLDCYGASLVRYDSGTPFKNYEALVKPSNKDAYEELYRALSY